MAKVITLSRSFPSYHIKKGQPTFFVEAFLFNLCQIGKISMSRAKEICVENKLGCFNDLYEMRAYKGFSKGHTIRKGKRWKTGDIASIRVWGNDINPKSGRKGAYHSKQITLHDVEVTTFDFEIKLDEADEPSIYIDNSFYCQIGAEDSILISNNDALSLEDFKSWFKYPNTFSGQVICWNKEIKY